MGSFSVGQVYGDLTTAIMTVAFGWLGLVDRSAQGSRGSGSVGRRWCRLRDEIWLRPQVIRWDINIRESTVLGFVGAGGIGILLYSSINQFAWREVGIMLSSIFVVVIASEFVSAAVRQRIT